MMVKAIYKNAAKVYIAAFLYKLFIFTSFKSCDEFVVTFKYALAFYSKIHYN